jgi:DNA polymerase elongation subunit (family B)
MNKPRILLYDCETSLQPVAVFQLQDNNYIQPSNILMERHLISVCWKWLGESKVYSVSLLDDQKRFEKDPHDDRHVVETFHKIMQEADVLVGHNSDSFDRKYLETRMLFHGLPALPPTISIDTYKVAKARFKFNSNRLDYISKFLGFTGKMNTPSGLWLDVLKGSRKAIAKMVAYNKQDVVILEQVFKKLTPYIPNYLNRELFGGVGCPRCGSSKVQSRGFHRAISRVYRRWQCQTCTGWFKSTKAEPGTVKFRIL